VDRFPCGEDYLRALGRAVFNFSVLEYAVVWVIELIEPGYMQTYRAGKKTAGTVAADFKDKINRLPGGSVRTKLDRLSVSFKQITIDRNDLLHANPAAMPNGDSHLIKADATKFIAWGEAHVVATATKFQDAAIDVLAVFGEMGGQP
jgi:hypothetical protein